MEFRLDWSKSALQDLRSICDYIAIDNPDAANSVGAEIIERAEILQHFPDLGPFYPRKRWLKEWQKTVLRNHGL